jgi:hypothetical protein
MFRVSYCTKIRDLLIHSCPFRECAANLPPIPLFLRSAGRSQHGNCGAMHGVFRAVNELWRIRHNSSGLRAIFVSEKGANSLSARDNKILASSLEKWPGSMFAIYGGASRTPNTGFSYKPLINNNLAAYTLNLPKKSGVTRKPNCQNLRALVTAIRF